MTVRFLKAWNGFAEQDIVSSLSGTEETRLIGLGFATDDIYGNGGIQVFEQSVKNVLTDPQKINSNIKGVAGVGNGKIYDEYGDDITKISSSRLNAVVIGDSFAAYGDGVQAGGSIPGPTSMSIIGWAFSQMAGQTTYQVVSNLGVGSKTIDLVITEQLASALAVDADILHIHAGINNLNPSIDATTPTVAQIVAKMDYLLSQCVSVPVVILDALCPLDINSISGAAPRMADIPLVNAGYEAIAAKYPNVVYNDIYTVIAVDATSGTAIPGVTLPDGIHLNSYGAKLTGFATAKNLSKSFAVFRRALKAIRTVLMPRFTGAGGTKSANSGTINGDIATGYKFDIVTNSSGVVVTASVDDLNNKQTVRIQNGNPSATVCRFQMASTTAYIGSLSTGDIVQAGISFDVKRTTGLRRHDLAIATASTLSGALQKSTGETTPVFPPEPYLLRLNTNATMGGSPSNIDFISTFEVGPGGDVLIDISALTVQEVVAA